MKRGFLLAVGVVVVVIGILASSAMFIVEEREQALVLQFGKPISVIDEPGLNFKLPIVQNAVYFDDRILDYDAETVEIPTLDQKQVIVDTFARYRITDPLLFYQAAGTEANAASRLGNFMGSALREKLGEVPMLRILTEERSVLMRDITELVTRQAAVLGIEVLDVRMKRVDLPEANSQAVFRRMQTQREQEARRIRAEGNKEARTIRAEADKQERVILAEARKTAEITRGEGDAEATQIYNEAYSRDESFFDFWRSMQAMQRGLGGGSTSYVGAPQGDFFRYFGDSTGTARDPLARGGGAGGGSDSESSSGGGDSDNRGAAGAAGRAATD